MISASSGLRLQRADPHAPQNSLGKPSGGAYVRISSSPWVTVSDPGWIRACADAAVPVRRWQRVQWQ